MVYSDNTYIDIYFDTRDYLKIPLLLSFDQSDY